MQTLEVVLSDKLIAVLEHARQDLIMSCRMGIAKAQMKNDEIGFKYWNEEIEDAESMDFALLHNIFIESQYRKINMW